MFRPICIALLLTVLAGCSESPSPAAPSVPSGVPSPAPPPITTFHLTGVVSEDGGRPVAGTTVTIYPYLLGQPSVPVVTSTDASGLYTADFDAYSVDLIGHVAAESAGYDRSYYYLPGPSDSAHALQNIHLYRIRRLDVGASTTITVVPGDSACGFDDEFVCRTVHISVPVDGTMTIKVTPASAGADAGLGVSGSGVPYLCCEPNSSFAVTAGMDIVAQVGMFFTSTASQSFVVNTTLESSTAQRRGFPAPRR